jgi:hypothetical protein
VYVLAEDVQAFDGYRNVDFVRFAVTEAQVGELGLVSSVADELIVQAEAIPPDVLARILDDALRENLDLDRMSEVAERSAQIRADYEALLRAAGLRGE